MNEHMNGLYQTCKFIAQKMNFSKDLVSKCDQIRRKSSLKYKTWEEGECGLHR